jgi:hypothetical protein
MANGTESDLTGIWASSATDIVVTGVNRTLLEGPSSMWPQITAASSLAAGTGLQAVWGDSSVVFAIGDNNAVLQRKDGGWTQLATGTLPPNAQLKAVYGADGVVIVVGLGGTVWRYAP